MTTTIELTNEGVLVITTPVKVCNEEILVDRKSTEAITERTIALRIEINDQRIDYSRLINDRMLTSTHTIASSCI